MQPRLYVSANDVVKICDGLQLGCGHCTLRDNRSSAEAAKPPGQAGWRRIFAPGPAQGFRGFCTIPLNAEIVDGCEQATRSCVMSFHRALSLYSCTMYASPCCGCSIVASTVQTVVSGNRRIRYSVAVGDASSRSRWGSVVALFRDRGLQHKPTASGEAACLRQHAVL